MQWLNTMRLGDGGFISTVDTIVAMEALVTYSYNSRIKDITDLTVEVDIPDSNLTHRSENHLLFTDLRKSGVAWQMANVREGESR